MIFLLLQSSIYVHHIMYQQVYQYVLLWKKNREIPRFSSVAQSGLTLPAHGLQHSRLPSPPPSPRVCSKPCLSSCWCHPTISSSVISFSSCPHSCLAWGSFQMSQLFASGGQSIGASASVLPINTQDLSPLGWIGWISLQSKGLSRVFSNTTVQKHQFSGTQFSL